MGRTTSGKSSVETNPTLWPDVDLPKYESRMKEKNFASLKIPLWTHNKAKLIAAYLKLFTYITKHGTYIDGFAAPQSMDYLETWAAKLVLENEPKWLRNIWLCDINRAKIQSLHALQETHSTKQRKITVLLGDFNYTVRNILSSGSIKEKTASFALLDQRTFECEWNTIKLLSEYKTTNKIEIFYFFPSGWIDRSLAAIRNDETRQKVSRWWGNDDWPSLQGVNSLERAEIVRARFEQELKYSKATIFPIHNQARGGRVMYHMIHASDHPEALSLMIRAYRKVAGRHDLDDKYTHQQVFSFLEEIQKQ